MTTAFIPSPILIVPPSGKFSLPIVELRGNPGHPLVCQLDFSDGETAIMTDALTNANTTTYAGS